MADAATRITPGRPFGRLVALRPLPGGRWWCRCRCGVEKAVLAEALLHKRPGARTVSCGCHKKDCHYRGRPDQCRHPAAGEGEG